MSVAVILKSSRWIFRLITFLSLLAFLLFVLALTSGYFLKKYLISHSEEWIGRKIDIGSIFIDPFGCSVTFYDFVVYEKSGNVEFFSLDKFYLNAVFLPLFEKKIQIEEVTTIEPRLRIVMTNDSFNFDDLVNQFSPDNEKPSPSDTSNAFPSGYEIKNLKIVGGSLKFFNSTFQSNVGLNALSAFCPNISSEEADIEGSVSFSLKTGGTLESNFNINLDRKDYSLRLNGKSLDISFLLPFIDKVMYVTALDGKIDSNLKLGGRFDKPVSEANGLIRLSKFEVLDTLKKPSIKLDRFEMQLDTISALKGNYVIRKVLIDNPYLKFNLTPAGNNLLRSYTYSDSSASELTSGHASTTQSDANAYLDFFKLLNDYFVELAQAYAIRFYSVDSLRLAGGQFEFDDYTLNRKFHFLFGNLSLQAAKIRSDQDSLKINLNSRLNTSGILNSELTLLPKDTGDLQLTYSIKELNINDFSPYSEYYVAHPFWDGVVYFHSTSTVVNSQLDSKNYLLVKHLEVGDKEMNATAFNLPLKLAVSLLKDTKGNIELKIPLKGDINDPTFKVFPVVMQIFKNLIVKAAASPYKLLARTFNASEDNLRDIKYDYLQAGIEERQRKSIKLLAKVLNQKEDLHVKLIYLNNEEWEKNQYALYESKLRFYCGLKGKERSQLTTDDSVAIDQIQRLDTAFVDFLQAKLNTEVSADVESACIELVGVEPILAMLEEVNEKRIEYLNVYLREHVDESSKFTIEEANQDEKNAYRDRPKFLMRFETQRDSSTSVNLARH